MVGYRDERKGLEDHVQRQACREVTIETLVDVEENLMSIS